jgi:hypothetical protein
MKTRTYKYNPRHLGTKQSELLMATGSPALGAWNVAQEVLDDFPVLEFHATRFPPESGAGFDR